MLAWLSADSKWVRIRKLAINVNTGRMVLEDKCYFATRYGSDKHTIVMKKNLRFNQNCKKVCVCVYANVPAESDL